MASVGTPGVAPGLLVFLAAVAVAGAGEPARAPLLSRDVGFPPPPPGKPATRGSFVGAVYDVSDNTGAGAGAGAGACAGAAMSLIAKRPNVLHSDTV